MQHCLKAWLDEELVDDIDQVTLVRGSFEAGQAVYKIEDRARSLFILQSGSVKLQKALEDGTNHVQDFYFRGDLFGLESVGSDVYGFDAIALEKITVCEIPYDQLDAFNVSTEQLHGMFSSLLGNKVRQSNHLLLQGRYMVAEQRLMLFLKSLCDRNLLQIENNRGRISLPMSKVDIASYLGLRPESLSRALSTLQRKGVILNRQKSIEILDVNSAKKLFCD